jgi:hypothetical protein
MLVALQNARSGTSADLRCWYQASDLNYQPSKNRRLNGVEYLRFNGIAADPVDREHPWTSTCFPCSV